MPKTKEELYQLKEDYQKLTKQVKELSEEELENVTGGTCYGDGWDGTSRAIVTRDNCCRLFEAAGKWDPPYDMICSNCKWYSYRRNGERISAVSGWCTHDSRKESNDVI